jgi:hypothetical protein
VFEPGVNFSYDNKAIDKNLNAKLTSWENHNRKIASEYGGMKDKAGFGDASYLLTADEVTVVKNTIQHVLRWNLKSPGLITTKNIGKGMLKYKYWKWLEVLPPRYTLDFSRGEAVYTDKEETELEMMGFDYDIHLTMPQIDYFQNSNRFQRFSESLRQGNITELTRSLAQYREWSIFRGSDIPNMVDIGKTGLVNDSSVQDPGAIGIGLDDDLTAPGDVYYSAILMATKLIQAKFDPPYRIDMTPKVFSQALLNTHATTGYSDLKRIVEIGRDEGFQMFNQVVLNPFLINSETETNTTGAILVSKPNPLNFEYIETYAPGMYALPPVDLGWNAKLLCAGAVAVYRGNSLCYADTLTTNT